MYLRFASDDMRFMTVAVGFIILSMGSVLDVQSLSDDSSKTSQRIIVSRTTQMTIVALSFIIALTSKY